MSLKQEIAKPLSNIDLQQLLNNMNEDEGKRREKINIFTVPEMIKNPKSFIEKMNKNNYCIIFINPKNQPIGHWVVQIKNKKTGQNYFIDSYGHSPAYYDQDLVNFYRKYYPNIKYNSYQYQKLAGNINTCGRYACLFGIGLNNIIPDLTPEKIKSIMQRFKKTNNLDYDQIVTKLVNFDL